MPAPTRAWRTIVGIVKGMEAPAWRAPHRAAPRRSPTPGTVPRVSGTHTSGGREAVGRPRFLFFLPRSRGKTLASRPDLLSARRRRGRACTRVRVLSLFLSHLFPPPSLPLSLAADH